jgi:molybdopterin converting factor subunit 1
MKVRVKLFAAAKELIGRDRLEVAVPQTANVADVRRAIQAEFPALGRILPHAVWAVGAEYASEETAIDQYSDIALIPPVSGG